ncbi:hypothetical protein GCM10009096_00950 [Parasphingorhabdus litoris]|uniref:Uncharacterized protein n=1 Tax=Parasphingorhabdus litoris TaxID=394733 RepID=A0ABN1A036_9SPHN
MSLQSQPIAATPAMYVSYPDHAISIEGVLSIVAVKRPFYAKDTKPKLAVSIPVKLTATRIRISKHKSFALLIALIERAS